MEKYSANAGVNFNTKRELPPTADIVRRRGEIPKTLKNRRTKGLLL